MKQNITKRISVSRQIADESADGFINDGDTSNVLDMFARGFISKSELADRLTYLLAVAKSRAEEKILGENTPDDPEARVGTWEKREKEVS